MPPWHAESQARPVRQRRPPDRRGEEPDQPLGRRRLPRRGPEGPAAAARVRRRLADRQARPGRLHVATSRTTCRPRAKSAISTSSVDPGFTEDKWVKAAECRPGNRAVVHHIIVGRAPPGSAGRDRELGGQHSEWLTATAPGARPLHPADGMAKLIPAGSKLVFQMHYTPNGTATEDRSCVGFVFADAEDGQAAGRHRQGGQRSGSAFPPGAANHKVEANHTLRQRHADCWRCSRTCTCAARRSATRPSIPTASRRCCSTCPRYDFNWQNGYEFAEPKLMPKRHAALLRGPVRQLGRATWPIPIRPRPSAGATRPGKR